jgi:predicted porin
MNKKLLPLAISAALAAGVAAPGAASADVTIYGKLHMSLDYFKSKHGPSDWPYDKISDVQVSSNSSRIGFKGSEELGGGLKAVWQIESGVNLNNGNGEWSSRNSFLGLSGGWGTVIAGKHDTPMKIVSRKLDPFGDTIFDTRAIMGSGSVAGSNQFNLRTNNTVAYISPSWGGFSVIGAYVADYTDNSSRPSDNDFKAYSASATYSNGPLYAAVAYEKHKAGGSNSFEPSMVRGGVSYKFGAFKLGFAAEKGNKDSSDGNQVLESIDRWAGNVFGTYDFGNNTIKLQYTKAGEAVNNDKSYMWSVGFDHKFSERTKIYAVGGQLNQDDDARYVLGGGHNTNTFNTAPVGENQNSISVGLVHTF